MPHTGVDGDEIAILERAQDVEPFVRILPGILFHPFHQGVGAAFEVGIVMAEAGVDELVVGFTDPSNRSELEERDRDVFSCGHEQESGFRATWG